MPAIAGMSAIAGTPATAKKVAIAKMNEATESFSMCA
jgi:hypothetical protein